MATLSIGEFTIRYENGLVHFNNQDGDGTCIRESELGLLITLLDSLGLDRRRSIRVPVRQESGLYVSISSETKRIRATCHDIGLAGMRIECETNLIRLFPNDNIPVTLTLGDSVSQMSGKIIRNRNNEYGVAFAMPKMANLDPNVTALGHIWERLQSEWISTRLYGNASPPDTGQTHTKSV